TLASVLNGARRRSPTKTSLSPPVSIKVSVPADCTFAPRSSEIPTMQRISLVLLLVLTAALAGGWKTFRASTAQTMSSHAEAFLETLTEEQRRQTTMEFDSEKRLNWHFIPLSERKGLQVRNMEQPQRKAALALLESALSEIGYGKATKIMAL